jgi:hypothetical protein
MSRFLDLADRPHDAANPYAIDHDFPAAVADSHLRLWKPGDPIPRHGTWILFGVAMWSQYDLHLLDVIDGAIAERSDDVPTVAVFNAGILADVREFESYIPGLEAHHTPVLGIWQDGQLVERKYGYHAHDRVARMFGTSADEVVDYVRGRMAARAQ